MQSVTEALRRVGGKGRCYWSALLIRHYVLCRCSSSGEGGLGLALLVLLAGLQVFKRL
jgi:MYXO-CTERM domain-containing protein